MAEPLCGQKWLDKHKNDYTKADIASLTIQIDCGDRHTITIKNRSKEGTVRNLMKAKGKKRM